MCLFLGRELSYLVMILAEQQSPSAIESPTNCLWRDCLNITLRLPLYHVGASTLVDNLHVAADCPGWWPPTIAESQTPDPSAVDVVTGDQKRRDAGRLDGPRVLANVASADCSGVILHWPQHESRCGELASAQAVTAGRHGGGGGLATEKHPALQLCDVNTQLLVEYSVTSVDSNSAVQALYVVPALGSLYVMAQMDSSMRMHSMQWCAKVC